MEWHYTNSAFWTARCGGKLLCLASNGQEGPPCTPQEAAGSVVLAIVDLDEIGGAL
jgi:hypothetical protein